MNIKSQLNLILHMNKSINTKFAHGKYKISSMLNYEFKHVM